VVVHDETEGLPYFCGIQIKEREIKKAMEDNAHGRKINMNNSFSFAEAVQFVDLWVQLEYEVKFEIIWNSRANG
jgi:hypothetical protein